MCLLYCNISLWTLCHMLLRPCTHAPNLVTWIGLHVFLSVFLSTAINYQQAYLFISVRAAARCNVSSPISESSAPFSAVRTTCKPVPLCLFYFQIPNSNEDVGSEGQKQWRLDKVTFWEISAAGASLCCETSSAKLPYLRPLNHDLARDESVWILTK